MFEERLALSLPDSLSTTVGRGVKILGNAVERHTYKCELNKLWLQGAHCVKRSLGSVPVYFVRVVVSC